MTSKNERVNCSSLVLFFCHAREILVEREKKLASQPSNPIACVYCSFLTTVRSIARTFTKKCRL